MVKNGPNGQKWSKMGGLTLSSASVNGILQCGLGGQKLYKGEKRDLSSKMRPKCGPILELLRTEESLFSSKYQKIFKKLILRKKCECLFFMVGLSYNPISQKMQAPTLVLNLISTSYSLLHSFTATFLSKWENETFWVKCGLNADHFISLVRMRTKSAIADFYGSSAYSHSWPNKMFQNLKVQIRWLSSDTP